MVLTRSRMHLVFAIALFAAGCAYGMIAERKQLFPYALTRSALSIVRGDEQDGMEAAPTYGRWNRSRTSGGPVDVQLTDEQREEMSKLETIGYMTGSRATDGRSGVTVIDAARAEPGVNLVVSGHRPWAALTDMDGNVLHEWQHDFEDAWPGREVAEDSTGDEYWRRVMLLDDGGIIAIHEGLGVVRLDADSKLVWAREGGYHHDLDVVSDGRLCVLDREARLLPRISRRHPVLEDFVAYLDPDGNLLSRFSLLEAFERSPYASALVRMDWNGDIFHTNTLEILDGSLADGSPAFKAGNLLISILMLDTIAVVDPESETVVWALTGMWRQQHQPTVLPNGRMLLYDNKAGFETSKVVEFDPFSQEVAWSYIGSEAAPFYSETCGSNQRLANGNTLITESDNGRAFETTPDGEIVWEFVNPHRAGSEGEYVATLFEVVRIPAAERPSWLE